MSKKKTTPPAVNLETKKLKKYLRVILTKEELLVAGKTQADKLNELACLRSDQKRVADDFKAKISALDADVQVLSGKISTGYEMRNVDCTATLGLPKGGMKTITRDDTGETIEVVEMSQEEMQRVLPIE